MLKFSLLSALALVAMVFGFRAQAADDDEDMLQNALKSSREKMRSRAFVGARDEQSLEVLATLPQPSRNPDGSATVPEDIDNEPTAPETD